MIAVVPVGDVSPGEITFLGPILEEAFGQGVVLGPSRISVPDDAYDAAPAGSLDGSPRSSGQEEAPGLERLLGIADIDLFVSSLNFVFGEADRRHGVAVMSFHRLRGDETMFRRRAVSEANHELGHAYGLSDCQDPRWVMRFSNTLAETDRKGTKFCQVHGRELRRRG